MFSSNVEETKILGKFSSVLKSQKLFLSNLKHSKNKTEILQNITKAQFRALLFITETICREDKLLYDYIDEEVKTQIKNFSHMQKLREWFFNDPQGM